MIDSDRFGDLFWHQFFLCFTTPRKLKFGTSTMRIHLVYNFGHPILATSFFSCCLDLFKNLSIWGPTSKSRAFLPNSHHKTKFRNQLGLIHSTLLPSTSSMPRGKTCRHRSAPVQPKTATLCRHYHPTRFLRGFVNNTPSTTSASNVSTATNG